jgi:hypothetical protein
LLLLDSPFQILRSEGITEKTAADLAGRVADEDLARLLMHAHELAAKGKLKNRAGYLRRGIESGFESIPTVEAAIKSRRRQLASEEADARRRREADAAKARHDDAGEAIRRLPPAALEALISEAVASIPPPLVRKDQTIGNPFVRAAVANLLLADHQST